MGEPHLLLFVLSPAGGSRGRRTPDDDPDQALLAKAREGDMDAFAELIREHEGRVYGIVCQYVKDEEEARDLTREVFYKAFRSLKRFRGSSKFSSWICRIAINRSIDHLRRKRNVRVESLDAPISTDGGGEVERELPDKAATPEELVTQDELGAKIREAVDQLSPKLRTVTILREYQGMSIEEISEVLKISSGTVKSRIFRARERLRGLLASYVEGSDVDEDDQSV
jgi:RNA polymerase sigma-70 factor (ECF subfamily)